MSSFSSVWLVASREIKERGRSKPYLITSAITGLVVLGLIIVPGLVGDNTSEYNIGSVGDGNVEIVETAEILGNINDEPDASPSVAMTVVDYDSEGDAESGLENGDVDVVLIDGTQILVEREGGFLGDSGAVQLMQQAAGAIALEQIASENGEAAQDVIDIISSDPLEVTALVASEEDSDTGSVIAYFGLLLLYLAIILYGTWILTGVTEEKANRVVEVMISAMRPWQLLAGKIVGIGSLAMAQFLGTLVLAYVGARFFATFDLPPIPIDGLLSLALWFVLGFLLYAVLFGAAGSLVGRIEDAQSAAMPMTMFSIIGFFAGSVVLGDPDGTVAVITTLIPFTAPFVVPIRVGLNAIPIWQFALSIVIMVITIYVAIRLAGRIYEGGILRSGQRTKLREAWLAART